MTLLIILALLLALLQVWVAPMVFSLDRLEYLLSNRDQSDPEESILRSCEASSSKSSKAKRS